MKPWRLAAILAVVLLIMAGAAWADVAFPARLDVVEQDEERRRVQLFEQERAQSQVWIAVMLIPALQLGLPLRPAPSPGVRTVLAD